MKSFNHSHDLHHVPQEFLVALSVWENRQATTQSATTKMRLSLTPEILENFAQ